MFLKLHGVTSQKTSQKIKVTIIKIVVSDKGTVSVGIRSVRHRLQASGPRLDMRHENMEQNLSSYDTPALTRRTSCRLKKESNDAKNKSQTNQNAGSFLCLGGCMDLMEVLLAMQP